MAHMIENRNGQDSVFVVGTPAWHRLGKVFENPPSIEEGIRAANLDWKVEKKTLTAEGGIAIPDRVAVVRDVDNKVLGVVGSDYSPVQNSEAFGWFQPWLDAGHATLESAGSLYDGKRIWVMAKINKVVGDVIPGDSVESFILLSNAHDGTMSVRAGFTPVRVVCANTLSMAQAHSGSRLLKVNHKGNVRDTLNLVRDTMDLHTKAFNATLAQYTMLATKQIDDETFRKYVRLVFAATPASANSSEDSSSEDSSERRNLENKTLQLFQDGVGTHIAGVRGTLWGALNAVTEYTTHHRGRNSDNRMNSLWFGDSANKNQKALKVAVEMATTLLQSFSSGPPRTRG